MPVIYARHVQHVGGEGNAQVAMRVPEEPDNRMAARFPRLAKYFGADSGTQRLEHESYRDAKRVIEQSMGTVDEYIFSEWAGRNETRDRHWNVVTAQISRHDYQNLIESLRKVPRVALRSDIDMFPHEKTQIDSLVLQLWQLNQNGSKST